MFTNSYYGLILAGGRGTRFWPKSRRATPKQVLAIGGGEKTLIQNTVDRLRPTIPPERIWVLTNSHVRAEIIKQLPDVPKQQIIAEPAQRNTAAAIGLAAHILQSIDPNAVMGVFPSDHVIGKPRHFLKLLRTAFQSAKEGRMVVLGISPRWPETGYGYVEFPEGTKPSTAGILPVRKFREKPDLKTAEEYVAAGSFFWNAGMFFWRADVLLEALRAHLPKTATLLAGLPPFAHRHFGALLKEVFPRCQDISIDYAVLEPGVKQVPSNVVGVACDDFGWNDVGSWNAVHDLLPKDREKNASVSELLAVASNGNYVDAGGKLVALLGVKDLIVVDTSDALLVAHRDQAQKVGELVKALEKRKQDNLL